MRKTKNAFTLIELLAVIVILAIIALIAVPVILNIIDKANIVAFKDTAYGIISAGELYFAEQQLEVNGMTEEEKTFTLPDTTNTLGLKGDVPKGYIKITRDGEIALAVYNDRYCVTKGYSDEDITITEEFETCKIEINEEALGFPINWNTMEVIGNTTFKFEGLTYVKVSEFTPSISELMNTKISVPNLPNVSQESSCIEEVSEMYAGFIFVKYDDISFPFFSVTVDGLSIEHDADIIVIPEKGFYALDLGTMGTELDFIVY